MKNKPTMRKSLKKIGNVIRDYWEWMLFFVMLSCFEGYLLAQKEYLNSGVLLMVMTYIFQLWYNFDKLAKDKAFNSTFRRMDQLSHKTILHDIKAPINGIISVVDLLIEDDSNEKLRRQFYDSLLTASNQALGVIKNMKDFNAMYRGERPVLKCEFILCEDWISEILKLVRNDAEAKGVTINIDVEKERKFYADRIRVTQIILNLLSNAVKFSHKNSVIVIKVVRVINQIVISIKDQGVGIDEDMQKKLFTPYARQYQEVEGEGLGLYSSKVETSLISGDLSIESHKNEGVTATLKIPVI